MDTYNQNGEYLDEQELYILWHLLVTNEDVFRRFLYKKKDPGGIDIDLLLYYLRNIFDFFKADYGLKLITSSDSFESFEDTETKQEKLNRTNYFALGKDLYEKAISGEKITFEDLQGLDLDSIEFEQMNFVDLVMIRWGDDVKTKIKLFLEAYLTSFIKDELEPSFGDPERHIGSFHSFVDLSSFLKGKKGKLLPKNIMIDELSIAKEIIFDETDELFFNQKTFDSEVVEYMETFRFLETVLSAWYLGFINIKHIDSNGQVFVDLLEHNKQKSNDKYSEIRNGPKKAKIIKRDDYFEENNIGYLYIDETKIEIGPVKNVPSKLAKILCNPIGKAVAIEPAFTQTTTTQEKYKLTKPSELQMVDVLKYRILELQKIMRKNTKFRVKLIHHVIDKTVSIERRN